MIRRPPRSTRTDTLFPYTTLFRSAPHCPRRGGEPFLCSLALALLVGGVAGEVAGRGEFAQLVTHHVLVHRDRHMLAAVIDVERQADELRQDGGTARPGLDRTRTAKIGRAPV